jgi:hypothetical protein
MFTRGNVFCQGEEIVEGKSRKLLLAGNITPQIEKRKKIDVLKKNREAIKN